MNFGRLADLIIRTLEDWLEISIKMLPNIALAIVVVILTWTLARFVARWVRHLSQAVAPNKLVVNILTTGSVTLVIGMGFFIILAILGLDKAVTSLLLGAGILLLALSFAFQDLASTFISGVILTMRQPFSIGDLIAVDNITGVATEVSLRSTILKTFDGTTVRIPNHRILQAPLTNFSEIGKRRITVRGAVTLSTGLDVVHDIAVKSVSNLSFRDPAREVEFFFEGFGEQGVLFQLSFWIDFRKHLDFMEARSEAVIVLKRALDEAGITMAPLSVKGPS